MGKKPRIFTTAFANVYPHYVQKAEKKGRTKAEVDAVIGWLTGYTAKQLERVIDGKVDFEAFFAGAPRMNHDRQDGVGRDEVRASAFNGPFDSPRCRRPTDRPRRVGRR